MRIWRGVEERHGGVGGEAWRGGVREREGLGREGTEGVFVEKMG